MLVVPSVISIKDSGTIDWIIVTLEHKAALMLLSHILAKVCILQLPNVVLKLHEEFTIVFLNVDLTRQLRYLSK